MKRRRVSPAFEHAVGALVAAVPDGELLVALSGADLVLEAARLLDERAARIPDPAHLTLVCDVAEHALQRWGYVNDPKRVHDLRVALAALRATLPPRTEPTS